MSAVPPPPLPDTTPGPALGVTRSVLLLWLTGIAFFFSFYLLLGTLPLYARSIGISERQLGFVVGGFAISSMVIKPWAGWASDRLGRRPLMVAGTAIFAAAPLAYAWSSSAMTLFLARVLHGGGMGLYPTAASAMVADVAPPARRGEFIGLVGSAANIAMAAAPLAGMAIARSLGYPSLFAVAAGCAVLAIALSLGIRETLARPSVTPFGMRATFSRAAAFPSLIVLLLMTTYGFTITFLPLHADRHGVNPGLFYLVFAVMVALVRSHAGRFSDRLGRRPVAVAGLLMLAASQTLLAITEGAMGLAAAGALYGLGFGTATPALTAWCVDDVLPEDRGRAMGTYYAALELGIAIGGAAAGLAMSSIGFPLTSLSFAITALAASLLILLRPPRPT